MKIGIRKPNIKKSIKARTTGKIKRAVKKSINPFYGKRGAGFVKNPVKSVKNSVYHRTTVGVSDIARSIGGSSSTAAASGSSFIPATHAPTVPPAADKPQKKKGGGFIVGGGFCLFVGVVGLPSSVVDGLMFIAIGAALLYIGIKKRKQ